MPAEFRVEGVEETQRALRRVYQDVENDVRQAHRDNAALMAIAVRAEAPKVSGQLASSVTSSGESMEVGAVYGGPINYGWRARGIRPRRFVELAFSRIKTAVERRNDKVASDAIRKAGLQE